MAQKQAVQTHLGVDQTLTRYLFNPASMNDRKKESLRRLLLAYPWLCDRAGIVALGKKPLTLSPDLPADVVRIIGNYCGRTELLATPEDTPTSVP